MQVHVYPRVYVLALYIAVGISKSLREVADLNTAFPP